MPRLPLGGLGGSPARMVVRGYRGRPIKPPANISGVTFWDAVRAYLKIYPTLGEITEIYFRRTKPGFDFPFLVMSPIAESPELNNSATYWEFADVLFSVVCSGRNCDEDAERIGQAAYRALAPKWRNDVGDIVTRDPIVSTFAYEMTALPGQKFRAEQPGRGPKNQNVVAFHFKYRFIVGRSMAENE